MSDAYPHIESQDAADMSRAVLEEALKDAAYEIAQAVNKHRDLAHDDASVHTDSALAALKVAVELEKALVDWQNRPAPDPEYDLAEEAWKREREEAA